ncbi:MAG: acylphosphatase [Bacteroidetes bacterium]|nr:MAG: acylphosphatase [Bacteroidota bacterium]
MEEPKLHYDIRVYGKVQGVWYRASTRQKAEELGLTGFVQNMPDGSVYIEAEGPKARLDALVAWCHEGPPLARVSRVEVHEGPLKGFSDFVIRR